MTAPRSVSPDDLLLRIASGDRAAFRALYAAAGPKLYAIALRMMRTRDMADDVFQEALVKVWERSWQFDPERGSGLAWLAALTRHTALDRLRRTRRDHVALDDAAAAEIDAAAVLPQHLAADAQGLQECLGRLREDYRTAVVLSYVNGLTHEELAERLARPLGTIKSWTARGLKQLKDCMER